MARRPTIAAMPVNSEMLLIPNTVAVVRGAPHAEAAQRLSDYLQQRQVAGQLASASALEGASAAAVTVPTLKVDWPALLRDLEETTATLNQIFLR